MGKISEETINALYSRFMQQKKSSKGYWEARSDYHYANSLFHMEQYSALKDSIKDSEKGTMVDTIAQLEKDVANLKAQLENADSERNEAVAAIEAERDEAQNDLEMLLTAIGLDSSDWAKAKLTRRLPTG